MNTMANWKAVEIVREKIDLHNLTVFESSVLIDSFVEFFEHDNGGHSFNAKLFEEKCLEKL